MKRFMVKLIVLVVALILTSCAPKPKFTVWHAWQGNDLDVLKNSASKYEQANNVEIQLAALETPGALLEKLVAGEEKPDIFIGYHTWGRGLLSQGITSAYCFPEQCQECFEPNPPLWCRLAGGDFSYRVINDFLMGVGYCGEFECDACGGENPPPWCPLALGNVFTRIDVLQSAMIAVYQDKVFPHGIPVWWEYVGIFANRKWFEENQVELPTTVDEVRSIVNEHGVYIEQDFFERTGLQIPTAIAEGNPSPRPHLVGIIAGSSDSFLRFQEQVGQLDLLQLADYRPEILVHGIYLDTRTENRSRAIDFMYAFTNEETQTDLSKATNRFPTNGRALSKVDNESLVELIQYGKSGKLALPISDLAPDFTRK